MDLAELSLNSIEAVFVLVYVALGLGKIGWDWIGSVAGFSLAEIFIRHYAAYGSFNTSPPTLAIALSATVKMAGIYLIIFCVSRLISDAARSLSKNKK